MQHFLISFLHVISEIDEAGLQYFNQTAIANTERIPRDSLIRIFLGSSHIQRLMSPYYPREKVRIHLAFPALREQANLLRYARVEAHSEKGGLVGVVLPLTVLSEDMVEALHAELHRQIAQFQLGSRTPDSGP